MDGRRRPTSYKKVRRFAWFFRAPPGQFPGPDADLPSFAALRGAPVCHAPSGRFITGAQASASPAPEEKLSEVRNAPHSRPTRAPSPPAFRARTALRAQDAAGRDFKARTGEGQLGDQKPLSRPLRRAARHSRSTVSPHFGA
jgi:hypothetical protein